MPECTGMQVGKWRKRVYTELARLLTTRTCQWKVCEVNHSPFNLFLRHGVNTRRLFSAVSAETVQVSDIVQTHSWAAGKRAEKEGVL